MPLKYQNNILKNKLENWEYILWDNESISKFLKKQNINMYKKYCNYKYLHQKVDFAKYCILYYLGGFAVDMDSFIIKDPLEIITKYPNYQVYISLVNLYYYESFIINRTLQFYNNASILAYPKSNLMLNLINDCPSNYKYNFNKIFVIQNTTGPTIFTKIANISNNVKILSCNYFEPCLYSNCTINDNTYVIHLQDQTWINPLIKKVVEVYYEFIN